MTQAIALYWGHPLVTPDGRTIRVPHSAFASLRKLGLLVRNKNRLSPLVYELLDPQYDCLAVGLRQLLGVDLSGPKWVMCNCHKCRGKGWQETTEGVVQQVRLRRER